MSSRARYYSCRSFSPREFKPGVTSHLYHLTKIVRELGCVELKGLDYFMLLET